MRLRHEVPSRLKRNTTPSMMGNCATCIALALAFAAAVLTSVPSPSDKAYQILQWLRLRCGPVAAAMAGAIADDPQRVIPP
jgi:hypothetical protein